MKLRERFADSKFVLLSHGLMIMDELHDEKNVNSSGWLGKILLEEKAQRKVFDLVFTLTEEECALEKWLGTPQTCWVPRTVEPSVLEWNPIGGRVGFVGTLDHPPNRQALVAVLNQLRHLKLPSEFQLHIVGRPADVGRSLADIYPFVRYLGALNDDDLRKEAATWCCFAHPLFAFARGCSTKLAVALAWQIPILATPTGVRGYKWNRGKLPLESTPEHFAKHLVSLSDPQLAAREREQVRTVAGSIANTDTIIAEVVSALRSIGVV
ncbi:MAG: glycosyltransferase [Verrucomicrobiota bacterium]